MRFQKMELYALEEVGRDELNNSVKEPVLIGLYKGTITPWTTEEIALTDRDITKSQRKLLTTAPKNVIEQADCVSISGDTYTIVDLKSDFRRWRLCYVKEYYT